MAVLEATPIYVEAREPTDTMIGLLSAMGDQGEVVKGQRQFGDVWWSTEHASYGIELKSMSDALHSQYGKSETQRENRLEWQLDGLRHSVDVAILGLHGVLIPEESCVHILDEFTRRGNYQVFAPIVASPGVRPRSLDGFLWGVANPQEGPPVQVIWRSTKAWLLEAIVEIYLNTRKREHKTFQGVSRGPRIVDPYVNILMGIDGVGIEIAASLKPLYPSIAALVWGLQSSHSDKTFLKIKGVGPKTIQKLKEALL